MESLRLSQIETTRSYIESGSRKSSYSFFRLLLLGILGGAFIAFASEGSNVAIHTIPSVGIAKALAGALFSTGLMMVVLSEAELFTGSMLMIIPCMGKSYKAARMIRNWIAVYIGNFIGSLVVAVFIILSGQFNFSGGMLGAFTIKVAAAKVGLSFTNAFFMGILCNWLVCMAVWLAASAKDVAGKILAIFFPIWLFIASGFEHSVANMYYIPAGILAKSNAGYVSQAAAMGVTSEALVKLNWGSLFTSNLIPVTLGNMIGGVLFVGLMFWISFKCNDRNTACKG